MHILDTDTLTHAYEGHPRVGQRLRECPDPDVRITIITKVEVLRGRQEFLLKAAGTEQTLRAQELLLKTELFLARFPVVPLDAAALAHFERLRGTRGLKKIGRRDLLIASTALARGATLVTRNLRHFRPISGLSLENWVD
jgi:tRNA(fMet)-specific endonuclease VapC